MLEIKKTGSDVARQVDVDRGRKVFWSEYVRDRGYSLSELLVALTLVAILATMAAPTFANLVLETSLTSSTNNLLNSLYFARSESIKRNGRVTVCTSVSFEECATDVGWHRGWIVFADLDGDGVRDAGEEVLLVGAQKGAVLTMTGNSPVRNYISYVPTGETRLATGGLQMGVVTACAAGSARRLVISATGRLRIAKAEC